MKKIYLLYVLVFFLPACLMAGKPGSKTILFRVKPTADFTIDDNAKLIKAPKLASVKGLLKLNRAASLMPLINGKLKHTDLIKNLHIIELADNEDLNETIASMRASGLFEYVEADVVGSGAGVSPNDIYYTDPVNYQWALKNNGTFAFTGSPTAKAGADIKMEDAWGITTGSTSIIVSILDTGLKLDQQEFTGRVWVNAGETAANGIDDDGNGYVDDVNGYNFAYNTADPTDDHNHGTSMAGMLGATGNDNFGIAGVDWKCKLMPVKVLNNTNTGMVSDWVSGILYSVNNGANVINMSIGTDVFSQAMKDACDFAKVNNVIVVACMQNFNNSTPVYPAAYESTIAVGSTSANDVRTVPFNGQPGSNYGQHIDLVAPGHFIPGPLLGGTIDDYALWSGTSSATALTSGVVSLMLGLNPNLTFDQVRNTLMSTADDQVGNPAEDTPGFDIYYGAGRLNAFKALQQVSLPVSLLSFSANLKNSQVLLQWQTAAETNFSHFEIEKADASLSFQKIATVNPKLASGAKTYDQVDARPFAGANNYRLKLVDKDGQYTYSKTVTIYVDNKDDQLHITQLSSQHKYQLTGIDTRRGLVTLQIFAGNGALVEKRTAVNSNQIIDLSSFSSGVYILKVTSSSGKQTSFKLLKN